MLTKTSVEMSLTCKNSNTTGSMEHPEPRNISTLLATVLNSLLFPQKMAM